MHEVLSAWLSPATRRRSLALTLVVCAVALAWQLGTRGLNEPDEGRYASIASEMLRSGNMLVPRFQGHLHVSKPPLVYWLTALNLKVFGVNEWAVRLLPALSALGTILCVWSLARRWWGPERAFHAALVLLTTPLFFIIAHLADLNMLLTFWVTLGWWSWLSWQYDGHARHRWAYYLAHAAAFLTKGPVGSALILLAVLSFRRFGGDRLPRRRIGSWPLALGSATLALSWHLYMVLGRPELVDYFLRYELFDRLFTNVHKRGEPFWFFWLVLPAGMLPWLPVLAPLARRGRAALRHAFPEAPLIAWVTMVLILFSIGRSKLATYILPAYPALALLAIAQLQFRDHCADRRRCVPVMTIVALAFLIPPALLLVGRIKFGWEHLLHHATVAGTAAAVVIAWLLLRGRIRAWIPLASALMLIAYAITLDAAGDHERALDGNSTARVQIAALRAARAMRPGPVCFTHAPAGMEFYLQDRVVPQHLAITTTNPPMTGVLYVDQLAAHGANLLGSGAYVIANTHYLQEVMGPAAAPDPFEVVDQGGKYTVLRVAR